MYKDIFLATIASIFAAIGLVTGSNTQLIGGMLVAPLLNPVNDMLKNGNIASNLVQFLILVATCIVIGMLFHHTFLNGQKLKVTEQLEGLSRYKNGDYLYDFAYGFFAGICLHVINERNFVNQGDATLGTAGIAIGVVLLPAFVTTGILLSANERTISNSSGASMMLGAVNIVSIVLGYLSARGVIDYVLPMTGSGSGLLSNSGT